MFLFKKSYRSGTVISKSFVGKDFLRIQWKYELTVHFKHEMIGKHFTETSNKMEFHIRTNGCASILKKFIVAWIKAKKINSTKQVILIEVLHTNTDAHTHTHTK